MNHGFTTAICNWRPWNKRVGGKICLVTSYEESRSEISFYVSQMLFLLHVSLAMPGGSSQLCSSVRQMFSKHKHAISLKHLVLSNCLDLLLWALCQLTRNPLFCLLNVHSQSQFLPRPCPSPIPLQKLQNTLDNFSGFSHLEVSR